MTVYTYFLFAIYFCHILGKVYIVYNKMMYHILQRIPRSKYNYQ